EEVTQASNELPRLVQKYGDMVKDANWYGGDKNCAPIAMDIAQKIAGQEAQYIVTTVDQGMAPRALAASFDSPLIPSSFESIASTLTAAGPGSQGLVTVYTYQVIGGDLVGFGHVFNVVNDAGYVIYINAQPAAAAIT